MRWVGIAAVLGVLALVAGCSGTPQASPSASRPSAEAAAPALASRVATLYGADPVDVARRQLAAEASQTAERFFASLERRTDDGGREWARVSVRDTEDPAEFEVEQVLLVMDERRQWRVVVHGSGLGLPPEDLVPYGLSVEAARRLFP